MGSKIFVAFAFCLGAMAQTLAPPPAAEQKKALAEATDYALNYEKNLPNFICLQVTHRFEDSRGAGDWKGLDTVNERLTYFDHHEDYKVTEVNGKQVDISHEKLAGSVSSGEFGSIMKEIFAPETETHYEFERWGTLRGNRMLVYSYRVELQHSNYHIEVRDQGLNLVTAYHGLIFVDNEHHFVHRLTLEAEGIPATFPIQELNIRLDYDFKTIGDASYLLPLDFELISREHSTRYKNDVDYRLYRKYGTETNIKFDTPDEEKSKEPPPVKKP